MARSPNMANPIHLLAFGFGSGLAPKAPGTFGTLAALIFVPLLWQLSDLMQVVVVAISFVIGIFLCGRTSDDMQVHDHGGIVWDEFVGMWATLLFMPQVWWVVVIGFVWFRLFDILKPWPIRWFDARVEGGFGIMIDDLIAALFAWVALYFSVLGVERWIL